MRFVFAAALVAALGCSKSPGDQDPQPEPDPKGWTITVDMSGLDRFVQPQDAASWPVGGVATATEGLQQVKVGGAVVEVDAQGAFLADVPVTPGLTRVPILATDELGHERKGDRTLLAARFLPDTDFNGDAAALVLDNTILGAMSDSIADYATDVDVAGEIMSRSVLSQDSRCVTWPVQAQQGQVTASLIADTGNLWLHIRVPNLYVYFEGSCQGLISQIPIAGQMAGTLDVWTRLTGRPPADGSACLTSFAHTTPQVNVTGWQFDVWGTSGPLQSWIVDMFSGGKSDEARSQLTSQVGSRADELLTTKLADVTVFDQTSDLDLLGRPIGLELCVAAIDKTPQNTLVARIAARAAGAGTREAPGAPQLDGEVVKPAAHELLLDGNLIGQLLFASWRDNGLSKPAPDIDAGILQVLVPGINKEFPDATTAQIAIDAELPPLVRVTPNAMGKLQIELGDLMIDISIEGKRVLRFGADLTLVLDLAAQDGALVPSVVDTQATVSLLDERHDGPDTALEQAVQSQIGSAASKLLGDNASIALPSLPGLGAPVAVTPDAGGRYLRVQLQ
jgi:hypothetical protein